MPRPARVAASAVSCLPTTAAPQRADTLETMKIALLRRFVVAAERLHFPRAAEELGISLASLYTSIDKLEEEVGHSLFHREGTPRLTPVGELFLVEAKATVAAAPPPAAKTVAPAGGKAKASKGKGRAPVVKGQPKPYKKRQGR
jgi:hypothetical protein